MYELPDNPASKPDIDGLFQKLAREYEPPFDPTAWQQMQARLDEKQPQPYAPARWATLLLAVLFILSGQWQSRSALLLGRSPRVVQVVEVPCQQTNATQLASAKSLTNKVPNRDLSQPERVVLVNKRVRFTTEPQPRSSQPAQPSSPSSTLPVRLLAHKNALPNSPQSVEVAPQVEEPNQLIVNFIQPNTNISSSSLNRQRTRTTSSRRGLAQQRPTIANSRQFTPPQLLADEPPLPPIVPKDPSERLSLTAPSALPVSQLVVAVEIDSIKRADSVLAQSADVSKTSTLTISVQPDSVAQAALPVRADTVAQTDEKSQPLTNRPVPQRGLSVILIYSPDYTGVHLNGFSKPGFNIGALLEYRLSRRWSVQAGVIRSRKLYGANASDYKWPTGWKLTLPFNAVVGGCDILDIPLNVRFDVLEGKKTVGQTGRPNRLFVTVGATTYIMQHEVYDYIYPDPTDPRIQFWTWKGQSGRYNFSEANVSVGFERPLSRRWSVQAEPFMKVPIERVGFFKVNLISTGVFFGLRYRF